VLLTDSISDLSEQVFHRYIAVGQYAMPVVVSCEIDKSRIALRSIRTGFVIIRPEQQVARF
jgi:hypothetical protein